MSLVEIVVYIGLLGVIAVFVANSMIQIAGAYQRVRVEREVLSHTRMLLDTISRSVAQAQEVYAPTSKFNDDAGQLSLVTVVGAQPEHAAAYIDFWVDNGVLLSKPEGVATSTLSGTGVRVTRLRFERIVQGLAREAVKATVTVDSADARFPASLTLNATTALRGNY